MCSDPDPWRGFERDGFVILRGILGACDLERIRSDLASLIEQRAQALHQRGKLPDLHSEAPFDVRFGLLMRDCPQIGDGFDIHRLRTRVLFEMLHHPRLLDALEAVLGPEISCNPIQHLRAKPPSRLSAGNGFFDVPWHQDSGVTLPEADRSPIFTCWIPIGRATNDMGCLRVLPGVHQRGHLPHVSSDYGTCIRPDALPQVEPVILECEAGDVVVMSQFTPHHSTPNRSDVCRWSLDMRYHVTGAPSGRPWYPEFVVRSRAHPERILSDYTVWDALWRRALEENPDKYSHRLENASANVS